MCKISSKSQRKTEEKKYVKKSHETGEKVSKGGEKKACAY